MRLALQKFFFRRPIITASPVNDELLAAEGKPTSPTKFETDKEKLRQTIRSALSAAVSFEDFAGKLLQQGVMVKESRTAIPPQHQGAVTEGKSPENRPRKSKPVLDGLKAQKSFVKGFKEGNRSGVSDVELNLSEDGFKFKERVRIPIPVPGVKKPKAHVRHDGKNEGYFGIVGESKD